MSAFTMPVSSLMVGPVHTVGIEDGARDAYDKMQAHGVSAVAVVGKEGHPLGVISRRGLLRVGRVLNRARAQDKISLLELPPLAAGDLMSKGIYSVGPNDSVAHACQMMIDKHVHRVFVIDEREGGRAVGVFSTKEAMVAVVQARIAARLAGVMSSRIVSVEASAPVSAALDAMEVAQVGGVVITDNGEPVGLFTEVEALEARDRPPSTPTEEVMSQSLIRLPDTMPLFRAAGIAVATRARRIVVFTETRAAGVVSGLDFARAILRS